MSCPKKCYEFVGEIRGEEEEGVKEFADELFRKKSSREGRALLISRATGWARHFWVLTTLKDACEIRANSRRCPSALPRVSWGGSTIEKRNNEGGSPKESLKGLGSKRVELVWNCNRPSGMAEGLQSATG